MDELSLFKNFPQNNFSIIMKDIIIKRVMESHKQIKLIMNVEKHEFKLSHQVLTPYLFTIKSRVHNLTSHNVTIHHHIFTCIPQINKFNFALILNLNNNIIISKQHIISQFVTYLIYHLYTISIIILRSQYNYLSC